MFSGIKNVIKQQEKDTHEGDLNLLLVRDGGTILQNDKYQEIMRQYPKLVGLKHERYETHCLALLKNFAEFVQDLPETRGGYFSLKGGVLEHSLQRTKIGLTLLRNYFIADEENSGELSEPQKLWAYAVFSAGILQGVGKILVDMNIKYRTSAADKDINWGVLDGSMRNLGGKYYRYDFGASFPEPFRNRVSMLLARQIMPEEGFKWLASNKDVFAIWLSLLDDDTSGGRTLGPILWMADDLAINHYFDEMNIHSYTTDKNKDQSFSKLKGDPNAKIGKDFIKWVKKSIASGKISVGNGPVHHVPGGVLLTKDVMSIYVKESSYTKNWRSVQTALTGMGIVRVGPLNQVFESYMKKNNKNVISGMVVRNTSMILTDDVKKKTTPGDYVKITESKKPADKMIARDGKFVDKTEKAENKASAAPGSKGK